MKKHVLAAIAASLLFAGAASAADLPARTYTKAPPAVAVAYDWTGFYIGGNVGGIWQDNSGTTNLIEDTGDGVPTNPQNDSVSNGAVFGGVQAGYNWHVTQWVFGVEADWDWTGIKNSFCRQTDTFSLPCADNGRGFLTYSEKTEWLASVRGRLGFAWDRVMVYATGGAAWGDVKTSINANCLINGCGSSSLQINRTLNFSDTRTGWVAGAGIETMLTPNWLLRAEYLHYDLGSADYAAVLPSSFVPGTGQSVTRSRSFQYDTVRAGLSYRFGGPVVAKY